MDPRRLSAALPTVRGYFTPASTRERARFGSSRALDHAKREGQRTGRRASLRPRGTSRAPKASRALQGGRDRPDRQGPPGPPGPVTGALPRGVTLRGTWTVRDQAAAMNNDISEPISWGFSLASAPATHFVSTGTPAPSGCAGGSAAAPAADPGNVCIYEAAQRERQRSRVRSGQRRFQHERAIRHGRTGHFDGNWRIRSLRHVGSNRVLT